MNHTHAPRRLAIVLTVALFAAVLGVHAQNVTRYKAQPLGSKVRIDGKANVHDWAIEGTIIGGYMELPASVVLDSTKGDVVGITNGSIKANVQVSIPISSLKNIHGWTGMDEVMMNAMNASEYPRIQYHLNQMTLKTPHTAGTPLQFDTTGELTLNGVTNNITMPVSIENAEEGKFKVIGSAIPIQMPDYKITPPVNLGVFVTQPQVNISFEWAVRLSAKAAE